MDSVFCIAFTIIRILRNMLPDVVYALYTVCFRGLRLKKLRSIRQ